MKEGKGAVFLHLDEYADERRLNGERSSDLCRLCFMEILRSVRPLFGTFF